MPKADGEKMMAEYIAFTEGIKKSGHYIGGDALQPTHTATTVRVRQGKVSTTDGPFAETKEQLGGFYLIDAKDLNDAIQVASKIPSAQDGLGRSRPIVRSSANQSRCPMAHAARADRRDLSIRFAPRARDAHPPARRLRSAPKRRCTTRSRPRSTRGRATAFPANPRAWLVSTGRFKAIDRLRRRARFDAAVDEIARSDRSSGAAGASTTRTTRSTTIVCASSSPAAIPRSLPTRASR